MKVNGEGLEGPWRKTLSSPHQEKRWQKLEIAVKQGAKQGDTRGRTASYPNSGHCGETPTGDLGLRSIWEEVGWWSPFPTDGLPTPVAEWRTWTTMWPGNAL